MFATAVAVLAPTFVKLDSWISDPVKLGLDLRGGSYLVLRVETDEAIENYLSVTAASLRREVEDLKFPVSRRKTKRLGDSTLQVVLLDSTGVDSTRKLIQDDYSSELSLLDEKTVGSEVKLVAKVLPEHITALRELTVEQSIEKIRNRVDSFGVAEPTISRLGDNLIQVQLPDVTDLSGVKKTIGKVAKLEFRLVAEGGASGVGEVVTLSQRGGGSIDVFSEPLMTGDAIKNARVQPNPTTGELEVELVLTSTGKDTFRQVTKENIKRRMAIVLDDIVQTAPTIQTEIAAGIAVITGQYTLQDANQLAVVLRSGALPASLKFEEERTVGATLGAESIEKSVNALSLGAILVVIFALIYYKRAGIVAVISLVFNLVLLLAGLSLFGATLTLPGIAGIVLTVGMAVDANVIIFERIKEELRIGSGARAAVENGFGKAWGTILDANATTFITGLILAAFGTGPIKGFAFTLCAGIITSMISALYVGRVLFRSGMAEKGNKEISI